VNYVWSYTLKLVHLLVLILTTTVFYLCFQ